MSILLINGNALKLPLADESVHCVVTSPPYWSLRDYGIDGQLGLEQTPEEYVANMVAVFREVKRVLRSDGTCWLNLGDSYAGSKQGFMADGTQVGGSKQLTNIGSVTVKSKRMERGNGRWGGGNSPASGTLKPKDLVGIPWRVAFALQADGWWLRSDIIWSKPNPMPESVTDRPTKAHEYLFLLAKSQRYYYDSDSIREPIKDVTIQRLSQPNFDNQTGGPKDPKNGNRSERRTLENLKERYTKQGVWDDRQEGYANWDKTGGRNRRTVWEIATAPYSGAHFATYPPALVEPCIKAGTSERGVCPVCGMGWRRVVEAEHVGANIGLRADNPRAGIRGSGLARPPQYVAHKEYLGWQPACNCPPHDPIPATVFDPFAGSGTTLMVARKLGRHGVGLDLSLRYLVENARQRLELDRLDAWGSDGKKDGKVITDLPLFGDL